jgi:hypothetical protein
VLPKAFRPKPEQIIGFGLWAPVAVGGLFYMIGDPAILWIQEGLGIRKPPAPPDKEEE